MRTAFTLLLIPILAAADDILVDAMSSMSNWMVTGHRVCYTLGQTRIETAKEPARSGVATALKLTYDLDRRSWVGAQWQGEPMLGRIEALSFWCHGDGSKHQLAARLVDANARSFEMRLGTIDWTGWRKLDVPMEEVKWTPVLRYGEERLPPRWPLTLSELRIHRAVAQPLLGSIAFSKLRATSRVQPTDRVRIAVSTDAPGNVFYQPSPATLRATFANPTEAALQGRVKIVVNDWLGREQRFDGGALELAARDTVERQLRVPITTLGAYQAWVQFHVGAAVREASQHFAISRKVNGPARFDSDSPFGMGLYLPRFHKEAELKLAIKLAREAGVKWTRDGLAVAQLAPEPGRWAWEPIRWTAGHDGGAVELSSGGAFTVPSAASLNRPCETGEITLSFWLKFPHFNYPDRWRTLLGKGDGPQRQFHVYLTVPTRQLAVSFGDGKTAWTDTACSKSDWQTNRWYHIVVTHRRADRSVRFWVDGQPAGGGQTGFPETLVANDLPLEIGKSLECGLDDLAIYDQALSIGELSNAKPVARWTFDENRRLRATDRSGNGNHAEIKLFMHDSIFEQVHAAGIHNYVILSGTPQWMASRTNDVPRLWTIMPQTNLWFHAVTNIVARYRDRGIHTWEIWNEPNIEPFWAPEPDAAEYFQVLAASYAAIKAADPQAIVMGCSLAGPHGRSHRPPWEFVEKVLQLGGGRFMDAISIHPYRQPSSPEDSDYVGDLRGISDLTAKYGRRLPIWITEVGWPNDAGGSGVTWATKMLPRAYLLALAAGVRHVAWYDYHDDGLDPSYLEHNCGLLLYDLTPKPPYFAFRTMATELAGMKFERELAAGPGATVLVFAGNGRRTAVAWSHRKEVAVALRVGSRRIESVELMGNAERLVARDGALLLTLTNAPMFLRNVPTSLDAVRPIACEPSVCKIPRGETGELRVTLRNPFAKSLTLAGAGQTITLAPGQEQTVTLRITASAALSWTPTVWRSADGRVAWPTPARVVTLGGQREPIFQRREETSRPVTVPHTPAQLATDEVTVTCWLRSDGPLDTWQAPVTKWDGDTTRNYGLYLGREKGELCFSASFEKGTWRHNDFNSGHSLFDGQWHHIAATYSQHDGEVCLYVDGRQVHRHAFDGGGLKASTAPLVIGAGFASAKNKEAAPPGAVRDIRVWNRALSAEEVARLKE